MFDLSRTPVREALRALVADGLVTIERNRGAIVATMSETDIRDQYELRARLESLAAERAATRMGADAIATLDAAIAEFDQGIELMSNGSADAGLRRITAANSAFHQAIVEGRSTGGCRRCWSTRSISRWCIRSFIIKIKPNGSGRTCATAWCAMRSPPVSRSAPGR